MASTQHSCNYRAKLNSKDSVSISGPRPPLHDRKPYLWPGCGWIVHRWPVLQNFTMFVTLVGMQMVLVVEVVNVILPVVRQAVMYQAAAQPLNCHNSNSTTTQLKS